MIRENISFFLLKALVTGLVLVGCTLLHSCTTSTVQTIALDDRWEFRECGSDKSFPASVPGCVHTDLIDNGLIPDPFFGANEALVQWVETKDWEYLCAFEIDARFLKNEVVELVFMGLDTYAGVFLNDSLVLEAGNMFREWRIPCRELLRKGTNRLRVVFTSPVMVDSMKALQSPVRYPDNRAFTRKAPYQYGWDWGPRLVTSGIWRPVFLEGWSQVRIREAHVRTIELSTSQAAMMAELTVHSTQAGESHLHITGKNTGKTLFSGKRKLRVGEQSLFLPFFIDDPQLWWCNGLGDQPLYDYKLEVKAGRHTDLVVCRTGVRSVELVQEPDSTGTSFFFRINGDPVFMKGANYIPQDNFPARVQPEQYRAIIKAAADAGMNMLRVWGGGIYEEDIFYDLCDEYGILVWQDFMFACNLYPGDEQFIRNVEQEAVQNIRRLRNHPSLALWCGNNEIDEGWHNWGWQKELGYSPDDSAAVWNDYLLLFEDLLPRLVASNDPGRPYWPSSPKTGWGRPESLTQGDVHYWGVWWGAEPFEAYEKKVGRFISEYGFQGFPTNSTLVKMIDYQDFNLTSEALLMHQKHPRGMQLIQEYMEREYHVPVDFFHYAYVSGLVQAYGISRAIEAHRRAMPWCMGTLYWQLNDCWPVVSWSGIDWYGGWKPLHYFVRDRYDDFLLSTESDGEKIHLHCVSDVRGDISAVLAWQIIDFHGNSLAADSLSLTVASPTAVKALTITPADHLRKEKQNRTLLYATLRTKNEPVAEKIHYFCLPKQLNLPEPIIEMAVSPSENCTLIRLKATNLAKNVFLESAETEGFFSDNYFDLLPGKAKTVRFYHKKGIHPGADSFRITTLRDTYKQEIF